MNKSVFFLMVSFLFLIPLSSHAYIGPGMGGGVIAITLGFIGAIFLAIKPASIKSVPVPQNGSKRRVPEGQARFTIARASLGSRLIGLKNGRFGAVRFAFHEYASIGLRNTHITIGSNREGHANEAKLSKLEVTACSLWSPSTNIIPMLVFTVGSDTKSVLLPIFR